MADAYDSGDLKNKIKHGEHLTFVDTVLSGFKPSVDTDATTGRTVYPKQEYLTQKAKERKEAADREKNK